jgi:signal transduction histidine kinase
MEDASHELRTPIYVAHTAAQVMLQRQSRPEEEYRESLITIDQQLKRLQHLVEELFVLARADSGTYPIQMTEFDLGETVADSLRVAKLLGEQKHIIVTGPATQELPEYGDEGLIRQLILILLDNAVKYTPEGGHIVVEIDTADPETYRIFVRDSGSGIPVESRDRIFDRFYRVDKSRSRTGAGLGLSIAQWITAIHRGSLTLLETGPGGSTFCVIFPRR